MMTAMKWVPSFIHTAHTPTNPLSRKHLDELKYPAPRTVSKLNDQVLVQQTCLLAVSLMRSSSGLSFLIPSLLAINLLLRGAIQS
jgi:hypothetical protein